MIHTPQALLIQQGPDTAKEQHHHQDQVNPQGRVVWIELSVGSIGQLYYQSEGCLEGVLRVSGGYQWDVLMATW